MSIVVVHPSVLQVSGVSRIASDRLEVNFDRRITDDQMINFWLAVKAIVIASNRPTGWGAIDKSDPDAWEHVNDGGQDT